MFTPMTTKPQKIEGGWRKTIIYFIIGIASLLIGFKVIPQHGWSVGFLTGILVKKLKLL